VATLLKTSRTQVNRLLDPENDHLVHAATGGGFGWTESKD
jgi:hypothetical protein